MRQSNIKNINIKEATPAAKLAAPTPTPIEEQLQQQQNISN